MNRRHARRRARNTLLDSSAIFQDFPYLSSAFNFPLQSEFPSFARSSSFQFPQNYGPSQGLLQVATPSNVSAGCSGQLLSRGPPNVNVGPQDLNRVDPLWPIENYSYYYPNSYPTNAFVSTNPNDAVSFRSADSGMQANQRNYYPCMNYSQGFLDMKGSISCTQPEYPVPSTFSNSHTEMPSNWMGNWALGAGPGAWTAPFTTTTLTSANPQMAFRTSPISEYFTAHWTTLYLFTLFSSCF